MIPFRARFAAKRVFSPAYYRHLSGILAHPLGFYSILIRKLSPSSSKEPLDLRLKDGKIIRVREFWTLFLFDEIFVGACYEPLRLGHHGPFPTILDVGANIGLFMLRMKQLWPDARIVAIEPHPENLRSLREHIEINHLTGVEVLQGGISEECGCMNLYLSPRNIGGHSMYKQTDAPSISVPVFPLSDVLAKVSAEGGGFFLKIDCEGCEHSLISSMTQEIADRISCIIFEPEHGLYNLDDLLQKLKDLGYTTSMFSNLVFAERDAPAANRAHLVE